MYLLVISHKELSAHGHETFKIETSVFYQKVKICIWFNFALNHYRRESLGSCTYPFYPRRLEKEFQNILLLRSDHL